MAVFIEEVHVGDVAAVPTVDVAWGLEEHDKENSLCRADCGLRKRSSSQPKPPLLSSW